jgi:hypothetical protein
MLCPKVYEYVLMYVGRYTRGWRDGQDNGKGGNSPHPPVISNWHSMRLVIGPRGGALKLGSEDQAGLSMFEEVLQ